jgi:outer membrane protein
MYQKYIKHTFLLLLVFSISTIGFSQKKWSLSECIDYAILNNIQIKQTEVNQELEKANLTQSVADILPNLNGFASHTYNYGRTIDPFTNQFATNTVQANNFALSSSLVLFSGLQKKNTINQNKFNLKVSEFRLEKMKDDVKLNIATAYIQILFNKELLKIAEKQKEIVNTQLDRTKILVNNGALATNDLLDVEAQFANEELQMVNIENQLMLSLLRLQQLLNMNFDANFDIEIPEIEITEQAILAESINNIYLQSEKIRPEIKAAEYNVLSSEKNISRAKGLYSPRLNLNASIGTGYSGLRKENLGLPQIAGYDTVGITTGADFVLLPNYAFDSRIIPFNKQLQDNINQSLGFNLTIPIFNNLTTKTQVTRAKISRENAQLELEQSKRDLINNISQAHADAVASYKKYQATQKSLSAFQTAFEFAKKRFDVGAANAYDFTLAQNRLANAESDLLQAKFDYVFKVKILEFYKGNSLNF